MFFLNEVPIEEFLGCSVGLCDWATVEQNFQQLVEDCNVDAFCDGQSSGQRIRFSIASSLLLVVLVMLKQRLC